MEHGFQFFRHFWHRFREVIVFALILFQIEQFDRSVRETLDQFGVAGAQCCRRRHQRAT